MSENAGTPRYIGGFCQDREKCVARNTELAALRTRLDAPCPDVEAQVFAPASGPHASVVPASLARDLARRLAEAQHDILAYQGALGGAIPQGHDGNLSSGETPVTPLYGALVERAEAAERALDEAQRLIKNLAPCGRYNGHDIEYWWQEATAAQSANARLIKEAAEHNEDIAALRARSQGGSDAA